MERSAIRTGYSSKIKDGTTKLMLSTESYDTLGRDLAFGMWRDGKGTVRRKIPLDHLTSYPNILSMRTGDDRMSEKRRRLY